MADSKQNDGDRDDPLLMLDQFMDFLKKNTMQLTLPSLERITIDTVEIESMGRKAESLSSLKGPVSGRNRSNVPGSKKVSDLDRKRSSVSDQKKTPDLDRKKAQGLYKDPPAEPERKSAPGLDIFKSFIPDLNKTQRPNGNDAAIPDRKRIKDDVEEIEKIADRLELLLNESEPVPMVEQKKMVSPRDRFIFSLKRSIPPIFGSLALLAYAFVVLRVKFGLEILRISQVAVNPNCIFLAILVMLLITLVVNSLRRYRIHMKVRRMKLNGEIPGGEAA